MMEQSRRLIELENEVKSLRLQLNQVLCYIDPEDLRAIGRISQLTPTSAKLRAMAADNPPPATWLEDDE